jgi:hypothetical protein
MRNASAIDLYTGRAMRGLQTAVSRRSTHGEELAKRRDLMGSGQVGTQIFCQRHSEDRGTRKEL